MKTETKYNFQKRIKQLEIENLRLENDLYEYRQSVSSVFDGLVEVLGKGSTVAGINWILQRMKRLLK